MITLLLFMWLERQMHVYMTDRGWKYIPPEELKYHLGEIHYRRLNNEKY